MICIIRYPDLTKKKKMEKGKKKINCHRSDAFLDGWKWKKAKKKHDKAENERDIRIKRTKTQSERRRDVISDAPKLYAGSHYRSLL